MIAAPYIIDADDEIGLAPVAFNRVRSIGHKVPGLLKRSLRLSAQWRLSLPITTATVRLVGASNASAGQVGYRLLGRVYPPSGNPVALTDFGVTGISWSAAGYAEAVSVLVGLLGGTGDLLDLVIEFASIGAADWDLVVPSWWWLFLET